MCQKRQAKAIKESLVVYLLKSENQTRANPHKARGIFPKVGAGFLVSKSQFHESWRSLGFIGLLLFSISKSNRFKKSEWYCLLLLEVRLNAKFQAVMIPSETQLLYPVTYYVLEIKRFVEMERKLRFFKVQMTKAGLSPSARSAGSDDVDLDNLEVKLGELEADLMEMNANNEKLQQTYNELIEYKLVVQKAGGFFQSAQSNAAAKQREAEALQRGEGSIDSPLLVELVSEMVTDPSKQVKLGFVSGLVPREKSLAFERILFRATKGNVFLKQSVVEDPVTDPASGEKVEKNVFVVFYSGDRARNKIMKICEAFGAIRYPFTEDLGKQFQIITEVSGRLEELKTTIDVGPVHQSNLLQTIAYHFEHWNLLVKKEKSIYHTLNMLSIDVTKKCLVAEGWCPVFASDKIQTLLQLATIDSNSQVGTIFHVLQTKESPPTYFHTNKFTSAFQEIVDAYGIAKYQEANPGVFTIITFPFLFAVMFGDWGHGICLFLASSYFIIREKKFSSQKLGDITEMIFGGRYVIMMMALFSIYTGLIYNEFFSVPFELFGPSAYGCHDPSCRYQFVPQMIFLNSLFGYLSLLIVVKWCIGSQADLYHVMIYMFLSPTDDLGDSQLFWGQKFLQIVFLLAALVSVPCMLFPKPFISKKQHHERHHGQSYALLHSLDDPVEMEMHHGSVSHEEFEFSEVGLLTTSDLVDFTFHSLAHSELSSVFYDKVLLLAWGFNNIIILIVGIFVFICATVGVLLVMETLSAFLHALRLNWVEFQNKFYEGDGYKFQPFSFALLGEEDE
ncbi:hypothetical protein CRYUN_Cryun30bG0018100 [Craigia yunnanensis]